MPEAGNRLVKGEGEGSGEASQAMRAQELIEQLARNDRPLGPAVHALMSAADNNGSATIDSVAVIYRDDYLAALRAEGKDADQEAGRLSLDEVRSHLTKSVF